MKAIVHEQYGPPDGLEVREIERPAPARGDVLVRVRAASVNPADWHLVRGEPYIARLSFGFPRPKRVVVGSDLAGTVEALGADVTAFEVGDEVFGCSFMRGFGAFGEFAAVPVDVLDRKPAELSFEQAAALPLAALTALQGLRDHGRVAPGRSVLIVGATGGVGTFAVQIAKSMGAQVTAVCSTANVERARALGAHEVIDYTRYARSRSW